MINNVEKKIQFESSVAALKFLLGTASTCHATCQIKLDYWDKTWNNLKFVSLEFKGYNYSTKTCCSSAYSAQLYINCSRWRKGKLRKALLQIDYLIGLRLINT